MQLSLRCISIILFALSFGLELHAQTGKLKIELTLNKDLANDLKKLSFYGDLTQGDLNDKSHYYKEAVFDEHSTTTTVDSLKEGVYRLVITGRWTTTVKGYSRSFWLKSMEIENVIIKSNATEMLKIVFPADCKYYKDFHNNTCPKCHKSDQVIFMAYGSPIIDPLTGDMAPFHFSDNEPTGCDPILYCKRDKLEF